MRHITHNQMGLLMWRTNRRTGYVLLAHIIQWKVSRQSSLGFA